MQLKCSYKCIFELIATAFRKLFGTLLRVSAEAQRILPHSMDSNSMDSNTGVGQKSSTPRPRRIIEMLQQKK